VQFEGTVAESNAAQRLGFDRGLDALRLADEIIQGCLIGDQLDLLHEDTFLLVPEFPFLETIGSINRGR
jgi:hypothetical protein